MPTNVAPYGIHHPNVSPEERVVLPGGGRLAMYPAVRTRWPGPNVGIGAGGMGMPGPMGGPLAWGAGTGIDKTAAAWRRYHGFGGMLTGYPLHARIPGRPGFGGYFGGWDMRD